jgi:hypothetical protein
VCWVGQRSFTATLDADGRVTLMAPIHDLIFGEIAGGFSERTRALSALLGVSGFNAKPSDMVLQDMWEKWASLGTGAGMCCLMRASIGDIVAAEGGGAMRYCACSPNVGLLLLLRVSRPGRLLPNSLQPFPPRRGHQISHPCFATSSAAPSLKATISWAT